MNRRNRKPWLRAGRGWYATVDGKQVPLGVFDPNQIQQARDALAALLANLPQKPDDPARPPDSPEWYELVESYMHHKRARGLKAKTLEGYRWNLDSWLARFGTKRRDEVTAEAIQDHAHSFDTWGPNQRRNYLCDVAAFLSWFGLAVELDKPGRESAGAESVITEQAHWLAVGAATGDLRGLLRFLWHTGCRPSEAAGLTAEGVEWDGGTIRLREHKTRGRGRDRLIYLAPAALELLKAQRERHGGGLLFRNRFGSRFSPKCIAQQMWRISDHIGQRVTAYGYRHTYATRALAMGLPDTHVAALLGHGSTRMIHAHYSHLNANARLLKEAAAKVG